MICMNMNLDQMDYQDLIDNLKRLASDENVNVFCYGYRSAHVAHTLGLFDRKYPITQQLEKVLAEKAGTFVDNHVVYRLEFADGSAFTVGCSDDHLTIGVGIIEQRW